MLDADSKDCSVCSRKKKPQKKISLKKELTLGTVITAMIALPVGGVAAFFARAMFKEGYSILFCIYIACAIGFWFIGHFIGRYINNPKAQRVMEYLCFITWFIPPLGIMNGGMAYNIARREQHHFFKGLSVLCVSVALINGLYGIVLALSL